MPHCRGWSGLIPKALVDQFPHVGCHHAGADGADKDTVPAKGAGTFAGTADHLARGREDGEETKAVDGDPRHAEAGGLGRMGHAGGHVDGSEGVGDQPDADAVDQPRRDGGQQLARGVRARADMAALGGETVDGIA